MPSTRTALGLVVAAAVASSASGPFARSMIDAGWSVGSVSFLRLLVSAAMVLPVMVWVGVRKGFRLRGNLTGVTVLSVFGMAGTVVCYYQALLWLPVGVAMILMYSAPVMVLVWQWAAGRSRPTVTTVLGAAIALSGLVLAVAARETDRPVAAGVAWAVGAAVCSASYFIASDRTAAAMPPVVLAGAALVVATALVGLVGVVGLLPLQAGSAEARLGGGGVPVGVPLVGVALLSTVFVILAGFSVVRVLGPGLRSFVSLAEPISAVLLAWLLVSERPGAAQLVGCALVVAGVVLIPNDRAGEAVDVSADPLLSDPGRGQRRGGLTSLSSCTSRKSSPPDSVKLP